MLVGERVLLAKTSAALGSGDVSRQKTGTLDMEGTPPIFGRFGFFVDPVKTKRGGSSPLSANPHAGSFTNLPRCDRAAGTESGTLRMGASPVQSPKSAAGRRPKL